MVPPRGHPLRKTGHPLPWHGHPGNNIPPPMIEFTRHDLVVAFTNAWNYLLVMYLIPASLAGCMQSLRKYIEHMGMTGSTVLSSTRSIVDPGLLGRLLAFTLFHEPFHGVHHKYARLPHAALPEFSDDLEPAGPSELPPFLTYRQALLDMLPSLLDPTVGSQWR